MELTKECVDEIVLAAKDVDYGRITLVIAGEPSGIVDIITEKRTRFKSAVPTRPDCPENTEFMADKIS
jgi:hypothetical protein